MNETISFLGNIVDWLEYNSVILTLFAIMIATIAIVWTGRCVSDAMQRQTRLIEQAIKDIGQERLEISMLSPRQWAEIDKEARVLAERIEQNNPAK